MPTLISIVSPEFGLFENPYADAKAAQALTNNAEARALALKAAQRSIILLKNDGTLPLGKPGGAARKTIAVIGPSANVARLGGYYGQPPVTISILDGIKAKVGAQASSGVPGEFRGHNTN